MAADKTTRKTTRKPRGRPFRKGQSGNPAGRPQGSRNKASIVLQNLLEQEGEAITRKAVELALDGDSTALRLVLDRLIPPARERKIELELPKAKTPGDIAAALGAVLEAVAAGEIAPGEGQAVAGLLEAQRRGYETTELEARLVELERKISNREGK